MNKQILLLVFSCVTGIISLETFSFSIPYFLAKSIHQPVYEYLEDKLIEKVGYKTKPKKIKDWWLEPMYNLSTISRKRKKR
jgi:hypothetical protein